MDALKADQKASFPDADMSNLSLPADVLYKIMYHLKTKDVLKCMQVCKLWKVLLSDKYFWKMFICKHFDLALMSEIDDEGPPFSQWSNPDEWFCYFDKEDDAYVMRPFPSIWKCGVIHPFGLDPMTGDVKSLQGFCKSLEMLTYMRDVTRRYWIQSGNECSGNEGCDSICVVLFPWDKDELPNGTTLLTEIFHVHPEIYTIYSKHQDGDELRTEKLFYHLPEGIEEEDDYHDTMEHDIDEKPCLNRIFGFSTYEHEENSDVKEVKEFYQWLQNVMVPTKTMYAGVDKLNPVIVFFITNLAPGWVGGALTGVNYT